MQKILKKIHDVMQDVKYIKKDAENKFYNYSYASELAIKTSLGVSFREHGIVFQLETLDQEIVEMGKDKQGVPIVMTVVKCRYTFYDVDSAECISGEFVSSGPARDDKGLWAATTNAIKYILTSMFLIPTGDDAESDHNHPPIKDEKKPPKTTKKPNPKKTSAKTDSTEMPRDVFSKVLAATVKKHCLVKPKKRFGLNFLLDSLCNISGSAEIAAQRGYSLPESVMIDMPEHTGFLVLAELLERLSGEELKITFDAANIAKEDE